MDFHKIWQEQCETTRAIRERFGVENALDYLIGEKLLNFAKAADQDTDFAAELPRFQAAVWEIIIPYELRGYVVSLKPAARKKLNPEDNQEARPVDVCNLRSDCSIRLRFARLCHSHKKASYCD
jgi:hypothetical protein